MHRTLSQITLCVLAEWSPECVLCSFDSRRCRRRRRCCCWHFFLFLSLFIASPICLCGCLFLIPLRPSIYLFRTIIWLWLDKTISLWNNSHYNNNRNGGENVSHNEFEAASLNNTTFKLTKFTTFSQWIIHKNGIYESKKLMTGIFTKKTQDQAKRRAYCRILMKNFFLNLHVEHMKFEWKKSATAAAANKMNIKRPLLSFVHQSHIMYHQSVDSMEDIEMHFFVVAVLSFVHCA